MSRRRKVTDLELAIVEAARTWAKGANPLEDMTALLGAVNALEAHEAAESARCKASGFGGDPAWPVSFSCTLPADHTESNPWHLDSSAGKWRSR